MAPQPARQLRASRPSIPAVPSGFQRCRFVELAAFPPSHAVLVRLPKLRVVGSSPIVRFTREAPQNVISSSASSSWPKTNGGTSSRTRRAHRLSLVQGVLVASPVRQGRV
jgi:hypothetical protein